MKKAKKPRTIEDLKKEDERSARKDSRDFERALKKWAKNPTDRNFMKMYAVQARHMGRLARDHHKINRIIANELKLKNYDGVSIRTRRI